MNLGRRTPVDRSGPTGLPRYQRLLPGPPTRRTIEIPLAARVSSLEEEVASLSRTMGDLISRLDDVAGRLEALEVTVHEVPPPPPPIAPAPPPPEWGDIGPHPPGMHPDHYHEPHHRSPGNRDQIIRQLTDALRYLQHGECTECEYSSGDETEDGYIADYNCGSLSCKSNDETNQSYSGYGDSICTTTDASQSTTRSNTVDRAPPIVLLDPDASLPGERYAVVETNE